MPAMEASQERWAAIDRELDALGKSPAELAAVIARARALASSIDVDAELEALANAREPSTDRISAIDIEVELEPTAPADQTLLISRDAILGEDFEAEPLAAAPTGSSSGGLSVDELFDDPELAPPTPATSSSVGELFDAGSEPPLTPSAAGLSVDELFADAELASAEAQTEGGGLADLFADEPTHQAGAAPSSLADLFGDDEPLEAMGDDAGLADLVEGEELRLSDPELDLLEDVVEAPAEPPAEPMVVERPRTMPPPLPSQRPPPPPPVAAAAVDEFELMVDEDILELDDEDIEPEPPREPPRSQPPEEKGGLISRLLRRK